MALLNAIGTLFPAIPLAIVALNFRYTSLASLMRAISAQLKKQNANDEQIHLLAQELSVMISRMRLVKFSLFFAGLSFVSNLITLYILLNGESDLPFFCIKVTIALLVASIFCFCIETILSTKALKLHLSNGGIWPTRIF